MTSTTPDPTPHRDLVSPVDRAIADALRDAGRSWGAVPEDVAQRHLAEITALAAEHGHAVATAPVPTWRSRMRRLAGLTIVKVAAGAGVAAAATTGGLAAGGHLPDRVQAVVADGADWIGIDLPRPAATSTPDTGDVEGGTIPPVDQPVEAPEDAVDGPDVPGADAPDEGSPDPSLTPTGPPADVPASPSAPDEPGPPAEGQPGDDDVPDRPTPAPPVVEDAPSDEGADPSHADELDADRSGQQTREAQRADDPSGAPAPAQPGSAS